MIRIVPLPPCECRAVRTGKPEGCNALKSLTTGAANTGVGWYSLFSNTTGNFNMEVGAGTWDAIGAPGAGPFAVLDNTCFIGNIYDEPVSDPGTQLPVYVDQFNNVGLVNTSSRRFKHDIQPMDKASSEKLQPVTFKLSSDWERHEAIWFDRGGGRRSGFPARRARQEW